MAELDQELRRRAHRRRVAAGGFGGGVVVAVALAVILPSVLSGGTSPSGRHAGSQLPAVKGVNVRSVPIGDGAVHLVATVSRAAPAPAPAATTAAVARAEQAFAVALTRQLAARGGDGNVLDSPISADVALSMLELGAVGSTRTGIADALQAGPIPAASQAAAWAGLRSSLRSASGPATLQLANSAWLQKGVTFEPAYLAALATSFGDDAYQADFAGHAVAATAAINAWVKQETAGRIPILLAQPLDPSTILVLANALHFKDAWSTDLGMTSATERFTPGAGPASTVPAIETTDGPSVPAAVTSGYTAVGLPYQGGRYQALVIQPAGSLAAYVKSLTAASLTGVAASMQAEAVQLKMPSLTMTASQSLIPTLTALGMGQAFGPSANLAGISPQAAYVDTVQQADRLVVNKEGTDAAAATAVGSVGTAIRVIPPSHVITIDRPYLLVLRDTRTGLILMVAAVEDPSGS